MPNPLTDELTHEAKTELALEFAELKRLYFPFDVERQRFHNRTWNLYR
jgi:hypothetical protein